MLVGVVAHVNREHLVDKLLRDTEIDTIKWDDRLPSVTGCAENHIRVLKELDRHTGEDDWAIILEDDARPVPGFRDHLKRALVKTDTPLVGLYLGTGNPDGPTQRAISPAVRAAEASGSHWIVSDWFISTVGYAVRSSWLPALIAGISDMGGPVDNRINEWTHGVGIKTWYTQPSLVDHEDDRSLLRAARSWHTPRRAWRVGSRTEWNDLTVEMGYAEGWSPV
jgi:GR25 family glycosyltransferase involved in LPS biosynthesis